MTDFIEMFITGDYLTTGVTRRRHTVRAGHLVTLWVLRFWSAGNAVGGIVERTNA